MSVEGTGSGTMGESSAPPGWYADPEDETQLRYWDGSSWTESRSPAPTSGSPAPSATAPVLIEYVCPSCQRPVAPEDITCPHCGQAFEPAEPPASPVTPALPARAAESPPPSPVRVPGGGNVYDSAFDLGQLLSPAEREAYGRHTLKRFPTWLVVVLHFLTLGIFTFIYQGLKLSKLPLARDNDFRAAKGIGFCFIPFFNYYWVFRFVNAITDRLNFQLRLRGERPTVPRGLGIACCVLVILPFYTFPIGWFVLMPIVSAYMQSATNRLVDLREREAAAAATPAQADSGSL